MRRRSQCQVRPQTPQRRTPQPKPGRCGSHGATTLVTLAAREKKQEQCQIENTCPRGIDLSNTSNATTPHKYKRGSDPAHLLRRFALRSVGRACLKANRAASTAKWPTCPTRLTCKHQRKHGKREATNGTENTTASLLANGVVTLRKNPNTQRCHPKKRATKDIDVEWQV